MNRASGRKTRRTPATTSSKGKKGEGLREDVLLPESDHKECPDDEEDARYMLPCHSPEPTVNDYFSDPGIPETIPE